jgi:hypothetical protein
MVEMVLMHRELSGRTAAAPLLGRPGEHRGHRGRSRYRYDSRPRRLVAVEAAGGPGRTRWTRESITTELATWLLSGTAIDAQFLARYGPRGLVAATRRMFGRFEAALNVAALHNAKLYPDGPATRDARPDWPTSVAASRGRAPR